MRTSLEEGAPDQKTGAQELRDSADSQANKVMSPSRVPDQNRNSIVEQSHSQHSEQHLS